VALAVALQSSQIQRHGPFQPRASAMTATPRPPATPARATAAPLPWYALAVMHLWYASTLWTLFFLAAASYGAQSPAISASAMAAAAVAAVALYFAGPAAHSEVWRSHVRQTLAHFAIAGGVIGTVALVNKIAGPSHQDDMILGMIFPFVMIIMFSLLPLSLLRNWIMFARRQPVRFLKQGRK
jgi:hypothetical protein